MSIINPHPALVQSPVFRTGSQDAFSAMGLDDSDMESDPRLDAAVEKLSLLIRRYCPTSPSLGNSSDH
ncbi:MAG: hypothetical protein EBR18_00075 [Betaproteobacteria bacterium]|nr:hypothetical protein [Betaproteobacteria bacterium]